MQVQEDCVEDLLPHGRNLLEQFDIGGGGSHTVTSPESIERVGVSDGGVEAAIENYRHRLPHHLHENYAAVVTTHSRY